MKKIVCLIAFFLLVGCSAGVIGDGPVPAPMPVPTPAASAPNCPKIELGEAMEQTVNLQVCHRGKSFSQKAGQQVGWHNSSDEVIRVFWKGVGQEAPFGLLPDASLVVTGPGTFSVLE